jgi:pSer/pThr/pTyr-binding forkhead associated (FHA) protein
VTPIDDHTRVPVQVPAPAAGWKLVGPTTIPLAGTVIVGREPSTTLVAGASAVVVDDAARSMSKTHAALVVVGEKLTVEDLDSTNGVYISRDGSERRIPALTPTELTVGDTVLFGDVAFTVERGA